MNLDGQTLATTEFTGANTVGSPIMKGGTHDMTLLSALKILYVWCYMCVYYVGISYVKTVRSLPTLLSIIQCLCEIVELCPVNMHTPTVGPNPNLFSNFRMLELAFRMNWHLNV